MKKKNGFAMAFLLALLPCGVAAVLLGFSLVGFIQSDLALKYTCRSEGIAGQKKVSPLLKKLLSLNPTAIKLKQDFNAAQARLRKALATKNPVLIGPAQAHLAYVEMKRLKLDMQQKQLIRQSDLSLKISHGTTALALKQVAARISNLFLKTALLSVQGTAPKLAVRPDYPDTAPTYSPRPDFEQVQALAHHWQYEVQVRRPFSNFISGRFSFNKSCAVTLERDNSEWKPEIIKGKSSLKSVW